MSKSPKRMELTIFLTFLALFFGVMLALVMHSARDIQRVMLSELEMFASKAITEFTKVHDDLTDDPADLVYAYQAAMVKNEDGLQGSYPFQSVSFLSAGTMTVNQPVVWSRNALLLEVTWKDGTTQKIPMTFQIENSADVAQLLLTQYHSIAVEAELSCVSIHGYWKDGLFCVYSIKIPEMTSKMFESPVEPPEEVEMEELYLACTYSAYKYAGNRRVSENGYYPYPRSADGLSVEATIKSYGSQSRKVPFADRWNTADELISYGMGMDQLRYENAGLVIRKYSLFDTIVQQYAAYDSVGEFKTYGPRLYYNYVARFSPLGLAVQELMTSLMFYVVLSLFVLTAFFVYLTYYDVRNQEQRQLRDEINRQKQALEYAQGAEESRRQMTSAIAHELKTPIAVLSSYAEALQENIDQEKQAHYLSVLRVETDKMDRMVLELLDLSRLEAGKYKLRREAFDLEELTREMLLPLQEQISEKNINVTYQVNSPVVEADRFRMGQIIENFMTNAIRHTPEGGKIIIRIGNDRETFSVENQGSRIPQENLQKVWDTFWQGDASRNERGSGLGLSICRSIVLLHGGTCKAENTGFGVRFSVSLSEHMKLFQTGRIPQETLIELDYPIAQQYTNVEKVFEKLGLMSREALRREISEGNVLLGAVPVKEPRQKLYHGYVLIWKEYRITIQQDEEEKARALLMERMRPGGLGNPCSPTGWGGYIKR